MKSIASLHNAQYRDLASLIDTPRKLRAAQLCVLEGEHLIEQYVSRHGAVALLASTTQRAKWPCEQHIVLTGELRAALSSLATPSEVIALAAVPPTPQKATLARVGSVIAFDSVQDPGNLGSLLRTAAAAGIEEAWCSEGCAYAWSPKVLRASQGAQFNLVIRENVNLANAITERGGASVATCLDGARSLFDTQFSYDRVTFVVGNEGNGITLSVLDVCSHRVNIPMADGVESLNVNAAAAVLLFEWRRRCADVAPQ